MKINFFKLNRNRRFNYTPRYYKGKEEVNDPSGISRFNFESRFSKYRDAYNKNDFGQRWSDERKKMRVLEAIPWGNCSEPRSESNETTPEIQNPTLTGPATELFKPLLQSGPG